MNALSILLAAGWKHNLAGISVTIGGPLALWIIGVMFR